MLGGYSSAFEGGEKPPQMYVVGGKDLYIGFFKVLLFLNSSLLVNKVCYYSFHLILCYPDCVVYSWTLNAISVLKNLILSVKKESGRKWSMEPWIEFRRSGL